MTEARVLFLLALLLISRTCPTQGRVSEPPKVVRATYAVEDITLIFDDDMYGSSKGSNVAAHVKKMPRNELTYSVGLLVVNFDRPVHVRRDFVGVESSSSSSSSILDGDLYPEEIGESYLGLTRLDCPRLGISLPSSLPTKRPPLSTKLLPNINAFLRSTLPYNVLLPFAQAERYDLAWLLGTLALERHDDNRRMRLGVNFYEAEQDTHKRYVALHFGGSGDYNSYPDLTLMVNMTMVTPDDVWYAAAKKTDGNEPSNMTNKLGCSLTFLKKSSQQQNPDGGGPPPGSIVSTTTEEHGVGGVPIHGSITIDAVSAPFQPEDILKFNDHRQLKNSVALEIAMERVEIAIAEYQHYRQNANSTINNDNITATMTTYPSEDCLALPPSILNETKVTALLETEHVLLGRSRESQHQQFIGIIKGPLKSIVSPVASPLGGVMSATVMDVATSMSGGNLHDNIKDMHEQITSSLIVSLTAKVPEIMAQTVPYEISSEMASALRNRLTQFFLTDDMLPRAVGDAVIDLVAERIVKDVSRPTSAHISELVTPPALHLLTRSIAHSVVPTLVHVLTHNPLMDYYCYYCYHHKVYCSYCQYQPSQLYYAQYYTGFFSTYYADYYTDWFKTPTAGFREELEEEEMEEQADGRAFYASVPNSERDATWGVVGGYE